MAGTVNILTPRAVRKLDSQLCAIFFQQCETVHYIAAGKNGTIKAVGERSVSSLLITGRSEACLPVRMSAPSFPSSSGAVQYLRE